MPVLPAGVRRMWLRRFGQPTRRQDWAESIPPILAARMSAAVAMQTMEELDIPQTREILVIEAGALGADARREMRVTHGGVLLRLDQGPTPLPSDAAWEYWTVIV